MCIFITSRSSCSILHSTNIARNKHMESIRNAHIQEHLWDKQKLTSLAWICHNSFLFGPTEDNALLYMHPFFYLEGHPDGIYLGCWPGERGSPGPDGEQRGLSLVQLNHRLGDGALVLVTCHDEVKDDEGGEAEKADHTDEGKPVHLPENKMKHRNRYSMRRVYSLVLSDSLLKYQCMLSVMLVAATAAIVANTGSQHG